MTIQYIADFQLLKRRFRASSFEAIVHPTDCEITDLFCTVILNRRIDTGNSVKVATSK